MQVRLIWWALAVIECALLVMPFSPLVTRPHSLVTAEQIYSQTQNLAAWQEIRNIHYHIRAVQCFIAAWAVILLMVIVGYARLRKLRFGRADTAI